MLAPEAPMIARHPEYPIGSVTNPFFIDDEDDSEEDELEEEMTDS